MYKKKKPILFTAWTSCNIWVNKGLMYYGCNRGFPSHQLPMSLVLIWIPYCTQYKGEHCAAQHLLTLIKLQRPCKHASLLLLVHSAKWLSWLLEILARTEPLQRAVVTQPTQMQWFASLQLTLVNRIHQPANLCLAVDEVIAKAVCLV